MNKIMPFGALVFLLSLQNASGNVTYKRLIESLTKNHEAEMQSQQAQQTAGQNLLYKELRVAGGNNASNVVVSVGPDAFHSVILNYSLQQLVIIKFHNDNNSEGIKTYQNVADTFSGQALCVSVDVGNNAVNKILLADIENNLGLDSNMDLPIYLFCKDRKLLMPVRHGGYSQATLESIIKQYLQFLMVQPITQEIQSSNLSQNLYTKNNEGAQMRKKSIWKKNSELYKKFNAIF